ncbi:epoxyqueuosine reductase QueG [Methanohalophilus levihalophilus]|uniref:4Fe-4S binding protein n=1 Tax=Methanohalophilus levihalophilus TaxID=1431282 RepID=UPI001FD90866|nr:4Fe-4S binding protein [Methanohalophilus levihalophilus]MBP2029509.1 epoxyqueuosine reductase QueG [Methanohalophilus levihalophilus]
MNKDLKRILLDKCREMEIPIVGVASVESWETPPFHPWMPKEFFPRSIYPEARSAIVIGLPVNLPVLETTPSIYYHELYRTINSLLDQYTYRLSIFLTEKGHPSIFIPRDGYGSIDVLLEKPIAFFSHRHAAFLAGLGTFGVNNTLLTSKYGPRVRFGTILTTAKLEAYPIADEELCTRCMLCVKHCPVNALDEKDYPEGITNKKACALYSSKLRERHISPCGICIKVCPIGKDRETYQRENIRMYEQKNTFQKYHNAWNHVRAYGGK